MERVGGIFAIPLDLSNAVQEDDFSLHDLYDFDGL
jgi:hypothetical protein